MKHIQKILLVVFLLLISFVIFLPPGRAADISLAWDANDPAPTGYRIYAAPYGQPFDFTAPIYEGSATTCTVVVENADEVKFVARAYLVGESGAVYESADSNQVHHAVVVWTNPNLRVQ